MQMIDEIRARLRQNANEKSKKNIQKFISSSEKTYGVKVPVLNNLVKEYKSGGFPIVKNLWRSEYFEEKLLASKILGEICKRNPDKTMKLVEKFSDDIKDWAVCDTLATQGIRKITKEKQKEIFALSEKLVKRKNKWKIRFGIVLLINYAKNKKLKSRIKKIILKVKSDEYYVKKALDWINRKLK